MNTDEHRFEADRNDFSPDFETHQTMPRMGEESLLHEVSSFLYYFFETLRRLRKTVDNMRTGS
jgi:hypothetical protein